jgi:HD-like signal output (HDOD) protein
MPVEPVPTFDLDSVLEGIDRLAAQRPVAARIVAAAQSDETDAKTLAGVLATDFALAGRVMKLANSAYFGMRGRIASLQLAVTVVGFTTVRTMATVALTEMDDESRLPDDFWTVSTSLAVAASRLAPKFGERAADALCLGVLAQLGSALLYQYDRAGYSALLAAEPSFAGCRRAELERYGMTALQLTAEALRAWGFPSVLVLPLDKVDDRTSPAGGLLRAAYEVVSRLTVPGHKPVPMTSLTLGAVREDDLPEILYEARNQAEDLRQLLIGPASGDIPAPGDISAPRPGS